VEFVGHPLLDRVSATRGREATLTSHGLDPARPLVLLLPGSRPEGDRPSLPAMLDAARSSRRTRAGSSRSASRRRCRRADVEAIVGRQHVPVAIVAETRTT
jgi:lipid A disaccharide synthetase